MEDREFLDNTCDMQVFLLMGLGYILLSGWAREAHGNPNKTQSDAKTKVVLHKLTSGPHC